MGQVRPLSHIPYYNIAPDVIVRQYKRGLENLVKLYTPVCDAWTIYDNSQNSNATCMAQKLFGEDIKIYDAEKFKTIDMK